MTPSRTRPALAAAAAAALALAGLGCARPRAEEPPPVAAADSARTLPAGAVVGREGRYGGHAWLGIPYARPPVGALRWRAPEPAPPWSGTREALRFGSPCVQLASGFGGARGAKEGTPTGSEDCLFLNVYAPRFAPGEVPEGDARLPVMLWIHGGGNSIGEAGFYDGSRLASEERVVVVTTNYRLGPFGWFRHEAVAAPEASADDRSGNFGTLDLVAALRFVRENVAAFGGDPGNVTIFGESAGGANVVSLLVSPRAAGLFQRAIVESGGTQGDDVALAEERADAGGHRWSSREAVAAMLVAAKLAPDRAAAHAKADAMAPLELAAWLRERPAYDVLTAYGESFGGMISLPRLIRDGAVLPVEPAQEVFAAGGGAPVPVVLGTNRDEVKLFMSFDPEEVRSFWFLRFVRDRARYERDAAYGSRAWKAAGADEPAAAIAAAGRAPSFVYRFDWDELPTILGMDLSRLLGAAHGFEIPFVFGHFELGRLGNRIFDDATEASRQALSAQMRSYWAEFAYTGDPGRGRRGDLPAWPAVGAPGEGGGRFLVFDTPAGGGIRVETKTESGPALAQEIVADGSFASAAERCEVLSDIARRSSTWGRDRYAAEPACAGTPLVER